jgi:hypothetical protein
MISLYRGSENSGTIRPESGIFSRTAVDFIRDLMKRPAYMEESREMN